MDISMWKLKYLYKNMTKGDSFTVMLLRELRVASENTLVTGQTSSTLASCQVPTLFKSHFLHPFIFLLPSMEKKGKIRRQVWRRQFSQHAKNQLKQYTKHVEQASEQIIYKWHNKVTEFIKVLYFLAVETIIGAVTIWVFLH
jgi:hypothetical protein